MVTKVIGWLLGNKKLIAIGGLLIAFAVMGFTIKVKNRKIEKQQTEIVHLHSMLDQALLANETNMRDIAKLKEANEQCTLNGQINHKAIQEEHLRHTAELNDIRKKYDKLRITKVVSKCADVVISPDVIRLLQAGSGDKN